MAGEAAAELRKPEWLGWAVLGGAGLAGAALLFAFDPLHAGIYPVCWFHKFTGWACPGCGGLRALHQLLHGHLAEAFRYHPLLVALLPLSLAWAAGDTRRARSGRRPLSLRPGLWWCLLAGILLFTIARNLPVAPFSYFALPR